MTNIIISILLLLTFVGFIYYIVKGGNLVIGFFVMALLWSVIGLVPFNKVIQDVIATPALNYGPTIIYIVFGSWFGRVLVDSGIAGSISAQTEKVGRKAPILAAILVVLVTALIFSSAYGVGSVIAIGVILIPILLSIGVPKKSLYQHLPWQLVRQCTLTWCYLIKLRLSSHLLVSRESI